MQISKSSNWNSSLNEYKDIFIIQKIFRKTLSSAHTSRAYTEAKRLHQMYTFGLKNMIQ